MPATVVTAGDELNGLRIVDKSRIDTVIIDCSETITPDLNLLFRGKKYPLKIISVTKGDVLAIYSRKQVHTASQQDFIKAVSG